MQMTLDSSSSPRIGPEKSEGPEKTDTDVLTSRIYLFWTASSVLLIALGRMNLEHTPVHSSPKSLLFVLTVAPKESTRSGWRSPIVRARVFLDPT